MIRPLLLAVVLALSAAPAVAQPRPAPGSPTAVVQAFGHAVLARDWLRCAELTDPDELTRIRARFAPLFARDSTGRMAAEVLGVPRQLRLADLTDAQFAAGLYSFYVTRAAVGTALDRSTDVQILGELPLGADSAVVVYRWQLPAEEPALRSWSTLTAVRRSGRWYVSHFADLGSLYRVLGGQPDA